MHKGVTADRIIKELDRHGCPEQEVRNMVAKFKEGGGLTTKRFDWRRGGGGNGRR